MQHYASCNDIYFLKEPTTHMHRVPPPPPQHTHTSVLQLRLCCQTCGHLASEHRQLTDVDRYVSGELECASNRHCDYHIPIADVPKSPVFGPYDPIILPWNDTTPEQVPILSQTTPYIVIHPTPVYNYIYLLLPWPGVWCVVYLSWFPSIQCCSSSTEVSLSVCK